MKMWGWIAKRCMFAMFAINVVPAIAATEMVKTQPGFYRTMLGGFEVTALNDGFITYTIPMLTGKTPEQIKYWSLALFFFVTSGLFPETEWLPRDPWRSRSLVSGPHINDCLHLGIFRESNSTLMILTDATTAANAKTPCARRG
jgi:hypothetical protein